MEILTCFVVPFTKILIKSLSKIKCTNIYGVVLPKKSGKTECIKQLENDQFLLLDLEASIKLAMNREQLDKLAQLEQNFELTSYNAFYYPLAKDYIRNLKKNFKNKKIIVFHSDPNLIEYVGINKIMYLSPNNKLFKEITDKINGNAEIMKAINDSRDLIVKLAGNKLKSFDSWSNLVQIISAKYNLKLKL